MKPIAVFRFSPGDEPGRLGEWLDANGRPWKLVSLHDGEPVPERATSFAGIGMMGGPMSVNDALPWVAPMEALVRDAVDNDVPVIGHCLGGQLMAKALGAKVSKASNTEIGWIDVDVERTPEAREWFGGRDGFKTFEWHYEDFTLPPRATRVLTNRFNENQAYVVDGRHIGFQGHPEMTTAIARDWIRLSGGDLPAESTDATQNARDILANLERNVSRLNAVADDVYRRWSVNLKG
ncbi:MAG TPA: type 1 glutamine amidotransferase [Casimicrobiaceae bacterium]|nr:type 1 glutamine amidotransferase [Casimicrobiaceae bacterium]